MIASLLSRFGSWRGSLAARWGRLGRWKQVVLGVVVAGPLAIWAAVAPSPLVVFLFASGVLILLVRRARLRGREGRLVMGIVMLAFLLRCGAGAAHYYYASSSGLGDDIFGDARAYSSSGHLVAENLWWAFLGKPLRGPNVSPGDHPWFEILKRKYGNSLPEYGEYRIGLYGYLVGTVYAALGISPVSLKWLHGFIGVLLAWLIYRFLRLEGFRRSAPVALVLVAFYPSLFLWSVSGLREIWVILLPWLILGLYIRSDRAKRASLTLAALSVAVLSDWGLVVVAVLCSCALAWSVLSKTISFLRPMPTDFLKSAAIVAHRRNRTRGWQTIATVLSVSPAVVLFGLVSLGVFRELLRLTTLYSLMLVLLVPCIVLVPFLARWASTGFKAFYPFLRKHSLRWATLIFREWNRCLQHPSKIIPALFGLYLILLSGLVFWACQSSFRDVYSALVSQQKRIVLLFLSNQRARIVGAQVPMVYGGKLNHYEVTLARTATKIFPERFYTMKPDGHKYIISSEDGVDLTFVEFGGAFLQGFVTNLFRPFPTNRGPFLHRIASYQMVGLYGLYLLAVLGGVHAFRRSWRRYWPALAFIAISVGINGLLQGNVGTIFRHRDTWVIMVLVFAALGIVRCVDLVRSWNLAPVVGASLGPAEAMVISSDTEKVHSLPPARISSPPDIPKPRILYVSYNSLFEPIFQSQGLAYLKRLSRRGAKFLLITFEKAGLAGSVDHLAQARLELESAGITWFPLQYHKRPKYLSTIYDVVRGTLYCTWLLSTRHVDMVHGRGITPTSMVLVLSKLYNRPLIFDMRSSLAEAYADAGVWKAGGFWYRLVRSMETLAARKADRVVVETEAHRRILLESLDDPALAEKVEVIPCCVDLERFARLPGVREEEAWELVYLGSLSGWYKFSEMVAFYKVARESYGAGRMAFLTDGPAEEIRQWVAQEGLPEEEVVVESLPFAEVPRRLARARAGIVFTEPGRRLESLPVKVGEYLAAGLPLVVNAGMGDTEHLVRSHGVGVVVESFAEEGYRQAASELKALYGSDGSLARRCRKVARTRLSLETGAQSYWALYQSVGDGAEEHEPLPAKQRRV